MPIRIGTLPPGTAIQCSENPTYPDLATFSAAFGRDDVLKITP
jgi:hypothetical protein